MSLQPPKLPAWLLPCIALTAVIASYSVYKRTQVESLNKATSLAVEMETVDSLAASEGKPISVALNDLKAQGVNAVVLSEETVGDLLASGRARIQDRLLIFQTDSSTQGPLMARVERGLAIRFGRKAYALSGNTFSNDVADSFRFDDDVRMAMVRQCPIGLNPDQATSAKAAGMTIIGRANNPPGVSKPYVEKSLEWMNDLGCTVFLPQGDQVLGRRDAIEVTEKTLQARGMLYASPEFTKIGGDEELVKAMPGSILRLHSAQAAELDKLPYKEAVDRYAKASRERNMRVLLLRPVSFASNEPLTDFAKFARDINEAIRKDGGAMGVARPFTDSNVSWLIKLLLALSIVPTTWWVASTFVKNRNVQMAGAALLVLLALATKTHMGLQVFALLSAITFPLAAFLILDARASRVAQDSKPAAIKDGNEPQTTNEAPPGVSMAAGLETRATGGMPSFLDILSQFLIATALSFVGGLSVAGLLNSLQYFVKASEFQGIKIAVFAPIIIVAIYFLYRFEDMKSTLRNPITWVAALAALGLLLALAFMNSRTGNDNPAGVSDIELKMRNVLDTILFVRPRTKSFMVGHPMLFAGIGLFLWRSRKLARNNQQPTTNDHAVLTALLLTVGAIGQTDVVNTFCHLHTPFMLSLVRTGVALVPGVILGTVVWFLLRRGLRLTEVA